MKVCLINPNLSGDVSIVDIGLAYLATFIRAKTDHNAFIFDQTYHRRDWQACLSDRIQNEKPDIIGITLNSLYVPFVKDIIAHLKKHFGLPIILGGYHPSLEPEESIAMEGVDAICVGDGEFALKEYLDQLESGKTPSGIPGLWIRKENSIDRGPPRELIQDIDSLPIPDYGMWADIDRFCFFNGMIYFIGNRGCPYNCTYCSSQPIKQAVPGKHYRVRNPEAYVEEIAIQYSRFKDRGMRIAHTFDSVLTLDHKWLGRFCSEYRRTGLSERVPFSGFSRADTIDEERADMLAEGGCKVIRIGIEAGSEKIRNDIYEKNISNDQYRKAFNLLHRRGIAVTGYSILGGPGETPETMRQTFRLVGELKVDRPIFFTYRPLPKTRGMKMVAEFGGAIDTEKYAELDSMHDGVAVTTADLRSWQIIWFRRWCLFYYNMRRTGRLLASQRTLFIKNFFKYLRHGSRSGVPLQYLIGYFMVSGGDNLYH